MKKNILENAGHGSLGHRIFCILRDKILNEEYEKGQKLNEVVLSKELNISRTPIREALKQLELEGLVKSIPNKGVYVLGFSSRDIDDMLEIRVVLESLSVQLAIDRVTQEELDRIKEIYDLLEFYAEKFIEQLIHNILNRNCQILTIIFMLLPDIQLNNQIV